MSRHRLVRNLDIDKELGIDQLSSDDDVDVPELAESYPNITTTQKAQLDSAFVHVRSVLGDGLASDREIREALWDSYFDVEGTVHWFLEGREEAEKTKARPKERPKAKPALVKTKKNPQKSPKLQPALERMKQTGRTTLKLATPSGSLKSSPAPSEVGITPPLSPATSVGAFDMHGMSASVESPQNSLEPPPEMSYSHKRLVEEARRVLSESATKATASMIVIGHVDAGKSTLMGRLMYELGQLEEKQRVANERASDKLGKSSFSWAWGLDGLAEERERGVTMDITQAVLPFPHLNLTILDAPGHRDFVPNLISGASQADSALLVIDSGRGEFEVGFSGGGQSREHILLVRSLGVSKLIIAVNKLDTVDWSQARFEEICETLQPFLIQSGYHASKISFIPCAAMKGTNLTERDASFGLGAWYNGPTLAEELGTIVPPSRDIESPVRIPISNVFRGGIGGLPTGLGASGRVLTGVIQVGEKLRVLPGDEVAVVRRIEIDNEPVPWAISGTNVTLYLSNIERIHIGIGSMLCPPSNLVPLVTVFTAQIILFDLALPITSGATVELFHHSRDTSATISRLISTIDRGTGVVIKNQPRMLTKNSSAHVEIRVRAPKSGSLVKAVSIPLETFATNKDMGRILLRRSGATIGAGIVTEIIS